MVKDQVIGKFSFVNIFNGSFDEDFDTALSITKPQPNTFGIFFYFPNIFNGNILPGNSKTIYFEKEMHFLDDFINQNNGKNFYIIVRRRQNRIQLNKNCHIDKGNIIILKY